jgi:hypothetical protein
MAYANYQDFKRRKPFRWWHDAIIDWRLSHPGGSLAEMSRDLGRSMNYLSMLVNSDMFRARWEQRRAEHSMFVHAAIVSKATEAVDKSFEILLDQLEKKRDSIPFQALVDFQDKTLNRLGYGSQKGPSVVVNNQVNGGMIPAPVTVVELEEARAALRHSEQMRMLEPLPERLLKPPEEVGVLPYDGGGVAPVMVPAEEKEDGCAPDLAALA